MFSFIKYFFHKARDFSQFTSNFNHFTRVLESSDFPDIRAIIIHIEENKPNDFLHSIILWTDKEQISYIYIHTQDALYIDRKKLNVPRNELNYMPMSKEWIRDNKRMLLNFARRIFYGKKNKDWSDVFIYRSDVGSVDYMSCYLVGYDVFLIYGDEQTSFLKFPSSTISVRGFRFLKSLTNKRISEEGLLRILAHEQQLTFHYSKSASLFKIDELVKNLINEEDIKDKRLIEGDDLI
jgi:hypothetical protein